MGYHGELIPYTSLRVHYSKIIIIRFLGDDAISHTQRGAIAQLTRLQSTRNWASYAVLDDEEEIGTLGQDDFDTVASPRNVQASEHSHEVLSVASGHSLAFFCFNEESSVISRYVRALYYSALSLQVSSGFSNSTSNPSVHELSDFLQVEILSASGLAIADLIGTSDPYCVIFWQGEKLFQTKPVFRNLNPQWNETFSIPLCSEDATSCTLSLRLFDHDGSSAFMNDDFLGQVTLDEKAMPWNKRHTDGVSIGLFVS